MRPLILATAALVLLATPVRAQSIAQPAPPAASQGDEGAASGRPRTAGTRQTLEQHFQAANAGNDGHLTKEQAQAARWSYVNRNFDAIDKAHKGFVTVEDIRGYARERRAARAQQRGMPATSHG